MKSIARRTVLQGLLGASVSGWLVPRALAAQVAGRRDILILSGIGPDLPLAELKRATAPLLRAQIPFSIALDPGLFPPRKPGASPILVALAALAGEGVEILPFAADLAVPERYFQARAARKARAGLAALFSGAAGAAAASGVTIVTREVPKLVPTAGLRAAGFRQLLQLPAGAKTSALSESGAGVLVLSGGRTLPYADVRTRLLPMARAQVSRTAPQIIEIDMSGQPGKDPWLGLELQQTDTAKAGADITFTPASGLSDGLSKRREAMLAVALVARVPKDRPFAEGFVAELAAAGIPAGFLEGAAGAEGTLALPQAVAGAVLPVDLLLQGDGAPGIDARGRLELGRVRRLSAVADLASLAAIGPEGADTVLVIEAEALRAPADRDRLKRAIVRVSAGGKVRPVSLKAYIDQVVTADPVIAVRSAVAAGSQGSAEQSGVPLDQDALMEDARAAWRYIERFTDRRTGLCMAAVQVGGGDMTVNAEVAMWDIGNQLVGIRGAYFLGLIPKAEFVSRCTAVIEHLPRRRITGLHLPSSLVSVRSGRTLRADFNTSDVGRLLSALALLREEPELAPVIAKKLDGWQLADTVVDGRLTEVVDGRQSEFNLSQGAHFAVRAFEQFGINSTSPLPRRGDESVADWEMRLLYATAKIGPLGPEPLLYEIMEMPYSQPAAYLARMLFSEQLRTHREAGVYVCPSESSISHDPWFVYEGLDVGAESKRWSLQSGLDAILNRKGRDQAVPTYISSKAAYLWRATHSHAYSHALVEYVRAQARIKDLGFASSIRAKSGAPSEGYSDLNTNGVILSAIAYMLAWQAPG